MDSSGLPHGIVPFWLRGPWPVALALTGLSLIWLLLAGSPLDRFDREWTDKLLRARVKLGAVPHPDTRIFLVGLEKQDFEGLSTIAAEYRTYAEIIDMTTALGAAATGFDLILARGGPAEAAPILEAARRSRGVVFAEADTGEKETLRAFPFAPPQLPGGLVNIRPDADEVIRGYEYARHVRGQAAGACTPSLALALYLAAQSALADLRCTPAGLATWPELGADRKSLVDRAVPASIDRVNYRSAFTEPWPHGFKYASLSDFRRKYAAWKPTVGAVPDDLPGPGSMVIVGSVAPGSGDTGSTPFGGNEPKVQVHAAALSDLLQGEMLTTAGRPWLLAMVALFMALFGFADRLAKGHLRLSLLWLTLAATLLLMSAVLLIHWRFVFPAITPAAVLTLGFLAEAGRRSGLASLEKLQMRSTMAMYFSPAVLEEVLRNPGAMEPREAELTVLLTDLRNFTTITERFGTPVIFDLMNRVFEIETRAVIAMNGAMEHFLGDQFLGYWGAPQAQPDAAQRAMSAGRMIIEDLDALRLTLPPELAALFGFGLGIHRGKALVGNKGSRLRFDYGILGDIVNTAARVESLTKLYGVRWIVTREVLATLTPAPSHRFLDRVKVKGREGSVELIEIAVNQERDWVEAAAKYGAAWAQYEKGRFAEALESFEAIAREHRDRPSQTMAERCGELIASPPAAWDGAYALKEK